MQTAAMTNRFRIGHSSKAGFADSEVVVSHGESIRQIVVSHLAQTVRSQAEYLRLTNSLIHFAEQAYSLRDVAALNDVSTVLMNLPIEGSRQIGLYYRALAINRQGQREEAEGLLETVADYAPITYRARAIQTLGANHHDKGHLDEALRFQLEALRMASDRAAPELQTAILARWEISHFKSDIGDHKGALTILEGLSPLVQIVAKLKPFYFYSLQNDLAVELGELGRLTEANAALEVALASPYAHAYPNWAETRQELEAKRTPATPSVVAFNRAPEAHRDGATTSSTQAEPERKRKPSKLLTFHCRASRKDSFQRSTLQLPATATIALNAVSILDRALISVGPRAPPPLS